MDTIINSLSDFATYLIPISIFGMVVAFAVMYLTPKLTKAEKGALELIDSLDHSEIDDISDLSENIRKKELEKLSTWYRKWYQLFAHAHVGKIEDIKQPGTVAFMFALIGMGAGMVVLKVPGMIIGPIIALVALQSYQKSKSAKKNRMFDNQLGLLIDAMMQNISGMSPGNALVEAIGGLPDPLYSELLSVKHDIEVGTPIDVVLQGLGERNESREMKFLSSALRISIEQGADLVPQLKIISEKLEGRARITRKINEAVSQTKPTIMVVGLATPISAIYAYTREGAAEAFTSTVGMIAAATGFALYGIGLFLIMKIVSKTKEF